MPAFRYTLSTVAAVAALAVAVPAQAQVAAPPPGCAGVAAEDVIGDQTRSSPVGGPSVEGPAYLDLEKLYFTYSGGKTYANVQVADLTDSPDPGTATRWYVQFQNGTKHQWVRAAITATGDLAYAYGDYDTEEESYAIVGDTTGQMVTGEHGVITIQVPAAVGGKSGGKLANPFAVTYEAYYAGATNVLAPASDRAPDEANGKTYDVGLCDAPASVPDSTPAPVTEPAASTVPAVTESVVQSGALDVALAGKPTTAKKASKRRALPVKLRSGGTVTDIQATLYDARKKSVAKGSLARLAKSGVLKLKARKFKKGSYTLMLLGTNPDGRRADRALKLRLR